MPRETSPNVQRAREHLARADRLLAAAAPAPAAPVTQQPSRGGPLAPLNTPS